MTPMREAILRGALEFEGHYNVEELTRWLHENGAEDAALATVYRVVPLLVEAGIVAPTLLTRSDGHCYEAAFEREHHDHLVCTDCGKVVEFHFEAIEVLQRDLAERYHFELTSHYHELLGLCGNCRRAKRSAKHVHDARQT
jgi:Fur family transcriptional regulator, ferric uptake regulator